MKTKKGIVLLISTLAAVVLSTGCGAGTAQGGTMPEGGAHMESVGARACLNIHSRHLHAPLRGIFGSNSVSVAHYASFIGAKSPTKCDAQLPESNFQTRSGAESAELKAEPNPDGKTEVITPDTEIRQIENGLSAVRYDGDYWFSQFLERGGASSDSAVVQFLTGQLQLLSADIGFETGGFGCSTLAVKNTEGEALFGRNFDWENCEAMIVQSAPSGEVENPPHMGSAKRYASISTVNMDFIRSGYGAGLSNLPDEIKTVIALYAPLDGMNEKGLAVSVNMIQDSDVINQDTGKPDVTTTTAIRLLLDRAADVEEALALLRQYDMHSSMGMMVHFALADRSGRSVAVEYVGNEMVVTETPVLTNFYLAPGEKQGIGTSQSHTRYDILMKRLNEGGDVSMDGVRDALDSVSKDNFGAAASPSHMRSAENFESTEWSIVFNLEQGEARYYHRENYEKSYQFQVNEQSGS